MENVPPAQGQPRLRPPVADGVAAYPGGGDGALPHGHARTLLRAVPPVLGWGRHLRPTPRLPAPEDDPRFYVLPWILGSRGKPGQ